MSWLSRKFWPKSDNGMRDFSELSSYIVWLIILLAFFYDMYVITYGAPGSSISSCFNAQCHDYPILAFVLGIFVMMLIGVPHHEDPQWSSEIFRNSPAA